MINSQFIIFIFNTIIINNLFIYKFFIKNVNPKYNDKLFNYVNLIKLYDKYSIYKYYYN